MRKVNYHTHTALCLHAGGMEIDYVREALAARLDHNLKRYLKSYPNLNRGYRLHREKKEQRRNKSSK